MILRSNLSSELLLFLLVITAPTPPTSVPRPAPLVTRSRGSGRPEFLRFIFSLEQMQRTGAERTASACLGGAHLCVCVFVCDSSIKPILPSCLANSDSAAQALKKWVRTCVPASSMVDAAVHVQPRRFSHDDCLIETRRLYEQEGKKLLLPAKTGDNRDRTR